MTETVSTQDLMRYLDGELSPEERARVERALEASTELRRELAVFRTLKAELHDLRVPGAAPEDSVWDQVSARVARPVGWIFLLVGLVLWMSYGIYVFAVSAVSPWEKLGMAGVAIGILLLFAAVIWERYRTWLDDPYRNVHR